MTLVDLQTKRDVLLAAIANGLTEISVEGKVTRFQNSRDMVFALATVDKEIATLSGTSAARSILVQHGRG